MFTNMFSTNVFQIKIEQYEEIITEVTQFRLLLHVLALFHKVLENKTQFQIGTFQIIVRSY